MSTAEAVQPLTPPAAMAKAVAKHFNRITAVEVQHASDDRERDWHTVARHKVEPPITGSEILQAIMRAVKPKNGTHRVWLHVGEDAAAQEYEAVVVVLRFDERGGA